MSTPTPTLSSLLCDLIDAKIAHQQACNISAWNCVKAWDEKIPVICAQIDALYPATRPPAIDTLGCATPGHVSRQ